MDTDGFILGRSFMRNMNLMFIKDSLKLSVGHATCTNDYAGKRSSLITKAETVAK
jgi:hypothetical protein